MINASDGLNNRIRGSRVVAPVRWAWHHRPTAARQRRFQTWLSEMDRIDNERMSLVMAAVLRRDSTVVDVGACSGDLLSEVVRLAPDGEHIAYEPQEEFATRLLSEFPNVLTRRAAVCDENGESSFIQVTNGPGWSGLRASNIMTADPPKLRTVVVSTVRLDDDLPADYVPHLLKIDVNGAEASVFRGAMRTLRDHRPTLLFEHGLAARGYGATTREIFELVHDDCGFELFDLVGNGPLGRGEFERAAETRWSWLGRPI
jgi:FkbM family methyltransferase